MMSESFQLYVWNIRLYCGPLTITIKLLQYPWRLRWLVFVRQCEAAIWNNPKLDRLVGWSYRPVSLYHDPDVEIESVSLGSHWGILSLLMILIIEGCLFVHLLLSGIPCRCCPPCYLQGWNIYLELLPFYQCGLTTICYSCSKHRY